MNLELTLEQKMIQKMVREFTENEVKPIAAETDRTAQYPAETIDQLFRYGIMGMCVPKEYGGAGADVLSAAIAVEELSKHCASTGDIVATHNGLCCDPIMANGTEEQKKKYLPMLTTGRHVGAFALTERGLRCFQGTDRSQTGGRSLRPQRLQDLHHQRLCGRHIRRIRHDR